jgi:hypothetical protein
LREAELMPGWREMIPLTGDGEAWPTVAIVQSVVYDRAKYLGLMEMLNRHLKTYVLRKQAVFALCDEADVDCSQLDPQKVRDALRWKPGND